MRFNVNIDSEYKVQYYYRFDERTGKRLIFGVQVGSSPYGQFKFDNPQFIKKNGEPRESIVFKGKRYFKTI